MGGPLDANIWRSLESLKKYEQEDCGCKKQFEKIEKAKVDLLRKTKKMKHYAERERSKMENEIFKSKDIAPESKKSSAWRLTQSKAKF